MHHFIDRRQTSQSTCPSAMRADLIFQANHKPLIILQNATERHADADLPASLKRRRLRVACKSNLRKAKPLRQVEACPNQSCALQVAQEFSLKPPKNCCRRQSTPCEYRPPRRRALEFHANRSSPNVLIIGRAWHAMPPAIAMHWLVSDLVCSKQRFTDAAPPLMHRFLLVPWAAVSLVHWSH